MTKQSIGKTYAQIVKFGRLLENHKIASSFAEANPDIVIAFVESVDKQLLWTSTDEFFSVFTPIKRYADDGMWDYFSTMEMRTERLGSHFGKNDFKHLIMSDCFGNKRISLIGWTFMMAISHLHKKQTGTSLLSTFFTT